MCKHNDFDILYNDGSAMVRKCKECGQIEMRVEYWSCEAEIAKALEALHNANNE